MSTPATWKDRVDIAVAAAQAARRPPMGNDKLVATFRSPAAELIRQAAAARGVTVAGFIRRAALAMAAQTLEMTYDQVIAADPTIQLAGASSPAPDPSGRIGGPWEIERLRDRLTA